MRNIRVADRSEWVTNANPGPVRRRPRQSIVDRIATLPIIILVPALIFLFGPAEAAGPTVTLSPDHAVAGQKVRVSGAGFSSREQGVLAFDGLIANMPAFRANGNGAFRISLNVPLDAAPGAHVISALDGAGGKGTERGRATVVVELAAEPSASLADPSASAIAVASASPSEDPAQSLAPPSPSAAASATPSSPSEPTAAPSTAPTAPPATAAPQPLPTGTDLGVRAYYYLWWSTSHWHDKLGASYPFELSVLPLPAKTDAGGCGATSLFSGNQLTDVANPLFTQDDSTVLARDVRLAKAAGLNGFLLNWGGNGSATQNVTDSSYTRRFGAMLAASKAAGGFTNWLSYKTSSMPGVAAIVNDGEFIYRAYGSNTAWGRLAGKPVFVLTGSRKYSTADLSRVSTALRPMFFLIGDESSSTATSDRIALFDGLSYYWSSQNPYSNPGSFTQIKSLGDRVHAAGKPWLAPFAPGYNSELLRGGSCVPREDGGTLQRLWTGNKASRPEGWTLISWNEIAENTHVMPLTKWSDRYLDVVASLISSR